MEKEYESIKEKWKKVSNKTPYILYLIHLARNIVILTMTIINKILPIIKILFLLNFLIGFVLLLFLVFTFLPQ